MKASEIRELVIHQLKKFFMMSEDEIFLLNEETINAAAFNTLQCLEAMGTKYYIPQNSLKIKGEGDRDYCLNLYNSVMNCIFLYWLSRELFQSSRVEIADKVYYLNKIFNSVELFYEVKLPSIWSCEHPLGSVMGRAQYGDYFFFYQGCTVGGNVKRDGTIIYPVIGNHVKMFSNSKILGDSHIGNHVIISANCYIKDEDIPDGTIVFGQSPNLIFKENYFLCRP